MPMATAYGDDVRNSLESIARLVVEARFYLTRLPRSRVLYKQASWARDRTSNPKLSKRAWLVFERRSAQLSQNYLEHEAFAKTVTEEFEKLRPVLPAHEIDSFQRDVKAMNMEPTCQAVQGRTKTPGVLGRPAQRADGSRRFQRKQSEALPETKNGRSPESREDRPRAWEGWRNDKPLAVIANELDRCRLPVPKQWLLRKPPSRTWARGVANNPRVAFQAIDYRLKMASR